MAFDTVKKEFSRIHMWYCEITVDATTYRFCEDITPIPAGLEVEAASMSTPSIRPSQIDPMGGIGIRASVTLSFREHQDYITFGAITAPVRFWPSWRANHPGYEGADIAVYSGYIVNGEFDSVNFQQRDFILDSFSHNESGANVTAKDTLKLASNDRVKAPQKSQGLLSADITDTATSLTVTPPGVGDSDYSTSGYIRMGDEVCSYTRTATSDVLTIVRAQYNTVADSHSSNDVVQVCLYYNDTLPNIIDDLLQTYAGVPSAQIPITAWDDEASTYLPGLFESLITEPVGVSVLLKELAESAPHYLFWDERTNLINFVAVKEPPTTALTLTAEDNLLEGSTKITDKPDMRISTVIVNFGQYDPTKKLDETSNYRQGHVRFNTAASALYNDIQKYKVINSRWINNDNRVAAVRLAAKFGRRFESTPRKISFSLDAKDSDVWTGAPLFINSNLIVDASSARYDMPVQVLSVTESQSYRYEALEYLYGDSLPADLDSEDPNQRLVVLSGDLDQLKDPDTGTARTLRDIYDDLFVDVTNDYDIIFIIDASCVAGSSDNVQYAIDTGTWSEITTGDPIKLDIRGKVLGKGGDGADVNGTAEAGGPAIILNTDIRLTNTGIIGAGGGGGNYSIAVDAANAYAAGGGGAGYFNGAGGTGSGPTTFTEASGGSNTQGGDGAFATSSSTQATGGRGGGLGAVGQFSGGATAKAIELNGNVITYENTGTIYGVVS